MRIAKTLVSTLAIAGLIAAVGCADAAEHMSGVDHKAKSAPVSAPAETTTTTTTTTSSAPAGSAPATTTTTTTTSAPASAPAK